MTGISEAEASQGPASESGPAVVAEAKAGAGAAAGVEPFVVYFSSSSEYTKRFVDRLGLPNARIPLDEKEAAAFTVERPYVLVTPQYAAGVSVKLAIAEQERLFLNNRTNRRFCRGVLSSGQILFGLNYYHIAAKIIAQRLNVPILFEFELMGTEDEVAQAREGLLTFFATTNEASDS